MSEQRVERRLAAILAADVAGYSRLVGADEEATLDRIKTLRRELVDPKIAAGRFAEAAAAASRAAQANPRFSGPHVLHAAALAKLGRGGDASAAELLRELQPGITASTTALSARYANRDSIAALEGALREARTAGITGNLPPAAIPLDADLAGYSLGVAHLGDHVLTDRLRRTAGAAVRSGEGLLSEPIALKKSAVAALDRR